MRISIACKPTGRSKAARGRLRPQRVHQDRGRESFRRCRPSRACCGRGRPRAACKRLGCASSRFHPARFVARACGVRLIQILPGAVSLWVGQYLPAYEKHFRPLRIGAARGFHQSLAMVVAPGDRLRARDSHRNPSPATFRGFGFHWRFREPSGAGRRRRGSSHRTHIKVRAQLQSGPDAHSDGDRRRKTFSVRAFSA